MSSQARVTSQKLLAVLKLRNPSLKLLSKSFHFSRYFSSAMSPRNDYKMSPRNVKTCYGCDTRYGMVWCSGAYGEVKDDNQEKVHSVKLRTGNTDKVKFPNVSKLQAENYPFK